MAQIEQIALEILTEDLDLYPRNDVSSTHVTRMVDALSAGELLPAIVVDRASKRIVDGIHRYRAYKRLKRPEIEVIFKDYKNEGEMFVDAVALNRGHGRALDPFDVRRAVVKLAEFGFKPRQIGEIVKMPLARIEEINRSMAIDREDEPVPLKAGLMHLAGTRVTRQQERGIEKYGGMSATFYARQLVMVIQAKLINVTPALIAAMDELVETWREFKKAQSA